MQEATAVTDVTKRDGSAVQVKFCIVWWFTLKIATLYFWRSIDRLKKYAMRVHEIIIILVVHGALKYRHAAYITDRS